MKAQEKEKEAEKKVVIGILAQKVSYEEVRRLKFCHVCKSAVYVKDSGSSSNNDDDKGGNKSGSGSENRGGRSD